MQSGLRIGSKKLFIKFSHAPRVLTAGGLRFNPLLPLGSTHEFPWIPMNSHEFQRGLVQTNWFLRSKPCYFATLSIPWPTSRTNVPWTPRVSPRVSMGGSWLGLNMSCFGYVSGAESWSDCRVLQAARMSSSSWWRRAWWPSSSLLKVLGPIKRSRSPGPPRSCTNQPLADATSAVFWWTPWELT